MFVVFTLSMALYYFVWSILKPYNYGPDEYVRFPAYYYMFVHNTLPSGWVSEIRNDIWGFSYAFYITWLPGILSFICMKAVSLFTVSPEILLYAARFPSVVAGGFCVATIMKICDITFKDLRSKGITIVLFAWLPQFAFLASYVNNDIFALWGSLLTVYSWIKICKEKLNLKNTLLLSTGLIIIALSYYNAYGWILFSFVFLIILFVKKKDERKDIIKYSLIVVALLALFTGFFLVRNAYLYNGDFFGIKTLTESSEMYALDNLKPSLRDTYKNNGLSMVDLLMNKDFLFSTERSFFAAFAYTDVLAPEWVYKIYRYEFLFGLALFGFAVFYRIKKMIKQAEDSYSGPKYDDSRSDRDFEVPIFVYVLIILASLTTVFLFLYYNWGTDYEPQGRYLYPVLPGLIVFIGTGFDSVLSNKKMPPELQNFLFIPIAAINLFIGFFVFLGVYLPSEFSLADMSYLVELVERIK